MATVGWRLRCVPYPQWNTCSITHIHPASPALINSLKNRKKGRTHALAPSPDAEAQPCVSRTAHITEAPRFKSPSHSQTLSGGCCSSRLCHSARRSADPSKEDFSRKKKIKKNREKNLPATTDCVTSSSDRVTPPTRSPPPPQDGQRRFTHTQMIASERRAGTERKFAPGRVQLLLSAVLMAHARTHALTPKADF